MKNTDCKTKLFDITNNAIEKSKNNYKVLVYMYSNFFR